jgi:hypothetical protein
MVAASILAVLPAVQLAAQPRGGDGFLFHRPGATLALRVGAAGAPESSDVYSFISQRLTAERGDFVGPTLMADVSVPVGRRAELQFTLGVTGRNVDSHYRDLVDNDDREIEQSTRLVRVPLTAGVKWNLLPAGRSIGRYAWVPARVVPYVAAGGGAMHYSLRQSGDFVDYQTMDVFNSTLQSNGWAPSVYAAAGATWNVGASFGLNTEVRYDRARGTMRGDFDNFDKIGLSGVGLSAGLLVRF